MKVTYENFLRCLHFPFFHGVLTRRFKVVPKSIEKKVYTIKNIGQLDELADQAVDCQSLAEFTKFLESQK